jgi:hypothetical protein
MRLKLEVRNISFVCYYYVLMCRFKMPYNVSAAKPQKRCTKGERSEPFVQQAGLCAGWEIEFRLPGTAAD